MSLIRILSVALKTISEFGGIGGTEGGLRPAFFFAVILSEVEGSSETLRVIPRYDGESLFTRLTQVPRFGFRAFALRCATFEEIPRWRGSLHLGYGGLAFS